MKIQKLRDKNFQGFVCDTCGRNLKHAFSVNGKGVFGSECIKDLAGIKSEKQIKKQMSLGKIWDKILKNPDVYSLEEYVKDYGGLEIVEDRFFTNGYLG